MGGADYLSCAQEAEAGLMANGVWKYPNDENDALKPPSDMADLKDWKAKNRVLVATLTLLIEQLLQHLVKDCHQLWRHGSS